MVAKISTILGARPQFIKAALVSRVFSTDSRIEEKIIHTGQHFDRSMSAVFFEELAIPEPTKNLNVQAETHGQMTGLMLQSIETELIKDRPDLVLVYGDTNSTLAGGLAAAKQKIPVAHVEAGLRSRSFFQPEEINRRLTDHLSRLLLCPTAHAVDLLASEGIVEGVHNVGDVMYDLALLAKQHCPSIYSLREELRLPVGNYQVATIHRPENTETYHDLSEAIEYLRKRAQEAPVVFPLHPRARKACQHFGLSLEGLTVLEPLSYLKMTALVMGSQTVLTDSGGLQKEALFHGIPCITLRDETEWVETIEDGHNRLWKGEEYRPKRNRASFGDGKAAEAIRDRILEFLS